MPDIRLIIIPAFLSLALLPGCAGGTRGQGLPPAASDAGARLAESPRHAEWVTVPAGAGDSLGAWVVYPERSDRAPVVVVVHEILGLTPWVRAVADQLAAEGFVAVAPDLLSGRGPAGGPEGPDPDLARAAIATLDPDEVQQRVAAAGTYGMRLPAALPVYGVVGFCWGGAVAFAHAAHSPAPAATVVFYGTSPDRERLARVEAPVLGLYAGDDERVNATVPAADSLLRALGRTYEREFYAGAGHGFVRQQDGRDGANLRATSAAWPHAVEWLLTHLDR